MSSYLTWGAPEKRACFLDQALSGVKGSGSLSTKGFPKDGALSRTQKITKAAGLEPDSQEREQE